MDMLLSYIAPRENVSATMPSVLPISDKDKSISENEAASNQLSIPQTNVDPLQPPILYPHIRLSAQPHIVEIEMRPKLISVHYMNLLFSKLINEVSPINKSSKYMLAEGNHLLSPKLNVMSSPSAKSNSKPKAVRFSESGLAAVSSKPGEFKEHESNQPIQEVFAVKETSNQMLAEGLVAQKHNVPHYGGANNQALDTSKHSVSMVHAPLNTMGSDIPFGVSVSKPKAVRISKDRVSVTSTKMGQRKELKTDLLIQAEHELEKERKRRAHNEAARRSKLRRQQMIEASNQAKADELSAEISKLKHSLNSYSEDCLKTRRKNKALMDELRQKCSAEEMAELESQNPDPDPDDVSSDSFLDDESLDTSDSDSNVEADYE